LVAFGAGGIARKLPFLFSISFSNLNRSQIRSQVRSLSVRREVSE